MGKASSLQALTSFKCNYYYFQALTIERTPDHQCIKCCPMILPFVKATSGYSLDDSTNLAVSGTRSVNKKSKCITQRSVSVELEKILCRLTENVAESQGCRLVGLVARKHRSAGEAMGKDPTVIIHTHFIINDSRESFVCKMIGRGRCISIL